ncbi:MAG: O-antigen ligase family protein [Elusimicrobia bacterium]|nr:O-antigen ligase family protein [Elusimicrobiota bacterium]
MPKPKAASRTGRTPLLPNLLLPAGLWLIAAGVPLVWSLGLYAALTLPKLALVAAGLLVCSVGALWSWRRGTFAPEATPYDAALLAGAVVLAASTCASQDRGLSLIGNYNYYAWGAWPMAMFGAVCLFAYWGLAPAERRQRALQAVLASLALAGLYAILQASGVEPFPGIGAVLHGRAVSTMGSPVSLGACMALAVPLGLHWALGTRGQKAFGWVCLVLILGGLYASISRAAWIAAALSGLAYLVLTRRLDGLWRSRGRAAAAAVLCLALGAGVAHRLATRGVRSAYDAARVDVWRAAWTSWREHPWLGSGPDTFELGFRRHKSMDYYKGAGATEFQQNAHNDILQVLVTTGLVGLAAYLWLLAALGLAAWRVMRGEAEPRRGEAAALACGLLALFVNMKFNPVPLEALSLAALFAGMLGRGAGGAAPQRRGAWLLWALAALMAVSVFLAVRLWEADRDYRKGIILGRAGRPELAMASYQSALRLHPGELTYAVAYINFLSARAAQAPAGPLRRELHDREAEIGLSAVRRHPNVSNAHYARGYALMEQSQDGRPELLAGAEAELDAALRLDPLFQPLLEARLLAARLRGDSALEAELAARLRSLSEAQAARR